MSAATALRHCGPGGEERSLFDEPMRAEPNRTGGTNGTNLEELIAGVWEGLAVHGASPCPVCGATMQARYGAHARPVDGHCAGCGTTLT